MQLNSTQSQLHAALVQLNSTKDQLLTTQLHLNNTNIELDLCKIDNSSQKLTRTQILSLASHSHMFENSTRIYKNRIYLTSVDTPLNVTSYQQSCGSLGGKLVEIRHQDEYDVISDYLKNQHFRDFIMLGITDEGHEGVWTYMSDNSTLTFAKWLPGGETHGGTRANCGTWYTIFPESPMVADICVSIISSMRFLCEVPL